jgi:hypothetical protein
LRGLEDVGAGFEGVYQAGDCSLSYFAQESLELGGTCKTSVGVGWRANKHI